MALGSPRTRTFFDTSNGTGTILRESTGRVDNFTWQSLRLDKKIVDTVTPNYATLIMSGVIVNNGMTFTKTEQVFNPGSAVYLVGREPNKTKRIVNGSIEGLWGNKFIPLSFLPEPDDGSPSAKLKALANIDSTPHEMGEDVFEIRQTLKFVRNPLKALHTLSKSFKRDVKRRRRGVNRSNALASVWLQYRFAVTPLVNSAYSILDGLSDFKRSRPPTRRALGFSNAALDSNRSYFRAPLTWSQQGSRKISWRAGIGYKITNPAAEWRFVYGLRKKDVPLVLWQIVPLSFMVDRIVNISESISGLTNLLDPNITIRYAWVTKKDEIIQTSALTDHANLDLVSMQSGKAKLTTFSYNRQPWNPSIFDLVPPFKLKGLIDSVTKVTDLVALIVQNFR